MPDGNDFLSGIFHAAKTAAENEKKQELLFLP